MTELIVQVDILNLIFYELEIKNPFLADLSNMI